MVAKEKGKGGCRTLRKKLTTEGVGVLVAVVMAIVGQTQETAGGDDVTRAK